MRHVEISLYADQLTTTTSFDFAGYQYDAYVKQCAEKHLPASSFTGRWYTNEENLIDPAGFWVTYKGDINRFTVKRVVVEAIQGNRSVRIYDDEPGWSSSEKKWICHRNFNRINAENVRVIISFPGSSYEHVLVWNR
jgi:hypothetical protein